MPPYGSLGTAQKSGIVDAPVSRVLQQKYVPMFSQVRKEGGKWRPSGSLVRDDKRGSDIMFVLQRGIDYACMPWKKGSVVWKAPHDLQLCCFFSVYHLFFVPCVRGLVLGAPW